MIHFKIEPHQVRDCQVVEIWDDGDRIGVLYPMPDPQIKVHLIIDPGTSCIITSDSGDT